MPVVSLPLTQITVDGDTQPRAAIHDDTVTDYAEAMAAGKRFPPLVVFHDGDRHWLADGFHRFHAAQKAKLKALPCDVREGSLEVARWYATGANATHGLHRTNADKRRAVTLALTLRPTASQQAIANHCGVHVDLVRDVRRDLESGGRIPTTSTRSGRDGKSYPVPPPPPAESAGGLPPVPPPLETGPLPDDDPALEFPPPDDPPSAVAPAIPPVPPMPPAPPPATAGPAALVDGIGRVIPPHLHALWNRRQELLDMMHAIGKMRGALQRASEEKDPLFAEVHCLIVVGDLKMVYGKLSVCVPFAVCSNCHGLKGVMEGCRFCGGHGLISEYRWKSLVPENTRKLILSQIAKP